MLFYETQFKTFCDTKYLPSVCNSKKTRTFLDDWETTFITLAIYRPTDHFWSCHQHQSAFQSAFRFAGCINKLGMWTRPKNQGQKLAFVFSHKFQARILSNKSVSNVAYWDENHTLVSFMIHSTHLWPLLAFQRPLINTKLVLYGVHQSGYF